MYLNIYAGQSMNTSKRKVFKTLIFHPLNMEDKKADTGVRFKSTRPFKLKDKPHRQGVVFNLREVFGFLPETIVVEKVRGSNNAIFVRAILTPEEIEKEEKINKEKLEKSIAKNITSANKQDGKPSNKPATP